MLHPNDSMRRQNKTANLFHVSESCATTRVDPLTSILAVLTRSCQILLTPWQPWISWQDSYYDLTEIVHYSKIVSCHGGQNSKIIKNIITSVQAAETQSEASFQPTKTISTRFHNQNASTSEISFHAKMCEKLR